MIWFFCRKGKPLRLIGIWPARAISPQPYIFRLAHKGKKDNAVERILLGDERFGNFLSDERYTMIEGYMGRLIQLRLS